ncbi:MAG: hypothetical protein M1504_01070 [Candidatus Marsarchaeota archaeon]|nr:hypothetical protein [Candidatus Marsarchaeota archaeon]
MDEEAIMYLAMCGVAPLIAIAQLGQFGSGIYTYIIILLVGLLIGFLLIMTFADYVVFPLITGMLDITFQPYKNYKITRSQDAVVKNVNGLYYATGFVTANLFSYVFKAEKLEEDTELKRIEAPESWEKVIMSIPFSFKYHVLSVGLSVQTVRDELEGKRGYQEYQMSRALQSAKANDMVIADIQRKLNVIQARIDSIGKGEKPIASLMYIETTAVGVSEKQALDQLSAQVKQLQISMSAMDVQLLRVVGRELYTLFKFGFGLPTTYAQVATNFGVEK